MPNRPETPGQGRGGYMGSGAETDGILVWRVRVGQMAGHRHLRPSWLAPAVGPRVDTLRRVGWLVRALGWVDCRDGLRRSPLG